MPPSRAKANVNRDTEVSNAKLDAKAMMMIVDSIAEAPALEPVASLKISIMGKPVGVLRTFSTFPMEKRSASSMANARTPLIMIVRKMTFGIVVAESFTSSDLRCRSALAHRDCLMHTHMWIAPSKPVTIVREV